MKPVHQRLGGSALFLALAAALTFSLPGCDDGGDDDGSGGSGGSSGGGSQLAGSIFGGGNRSGGEGDQAPGAGGAASGAGGGGEVGQGNGGSNLPGVGEADPVEVSQGNCEAACTALLNCLVSACGIEVPAGALDEAIAECTPECVGDASAEELGAVAQLTANQCAGFNEYAQAENLCGDFEQDDFEPPEPEPGPGGGGASAANCQTFCSVGARCCGEDPECDPNDLGGDQCVQTCQDFFPAEAVQCVVNNANQACGAIESSCGDLLDQEIDIEPEPGQCDLELYCAAISCAVECGEDEACVDQCSQACIANPQACLGCQGREGECF